MLLIGTKKSPRSMTLDDLVPYSIATVITLLSVAADMIVCCFSFIVLS